MATEIEAVLNHHVQALISRNIDNIMEDYTDDSVVFTPTATFKGLQGIRAGFTAMLGMFTPEVLANMKANKQEIEGEYAYVLWSALPAVPFGGDTFYVHDGKIIMQSFVGQLGS